jgi:hypothetical protein
MNKNTESAKNTNNTNSNNIITIVTEASEFRLLQMTDMHLPHMLKSVRKELESIGKNICGRLDVNLVVNTGDLFCHTLPLLAKKITQTYDKAIGKYCPWTFSFGNHDCEIFPNKEEKIMEVFDNLESFLHNLPHCYYLQSRKFIENYGISTNSSNVQNSPNSSNTPNVPNSINIPNSPNQNPFLSYIENTPLEKEAYLDPLQSKATFRKFDGFYGGNFKIEIVKKDKDNSIIPMWDLFILNSRRYSHVPPHALQWMKDQINARNPKVPALLFYHVPNWEYHTAWEQGIAKGVKREVVCFEHDKGRIHDFLKTLGVIRGVFVGHDHTNDYHFTLDGVTYVYGRKTALHAYGGRIVEEDLEQTPKQIKIGAKMIKLDLSHRIPMENAVNHYSVFEDGTEWHYE